MKKTNNCNHPEIFRLAGPGDYIIANEYGIPLEIVSSSQARILAHSEKAEFTEGLQNAYYRIIKNYQ